MHKVFVDMIMTSYMHWTDTHFLFSLGAFIYARLGEFYTNFLESQIYLII